MLVHAPQADQTWLPYKNPCWRDGHAKTRCLPLLLLLGGFHSGAGSLAHAIRKHPDVVADSSSNDQFWAEDGKPLDRYLDNFQYGVQRVEQRPEHTVLVDHSQSTLAFYWAAGAKAHKPFTTLIRACWESNCTRLGSEEARNQCLDKDCLPRARAADQQAAAEAGISFLDDQHVPLLVRAVYGNTRSPRMVALLRDPIDRLHSAFYGYPHYNGKYGANPEGFLAFVRETLGAFQACAAEHGARRCAFHFETLGIAQEKVYFHCDQLLRGLYSVWLEVWMRFFSPSELLIINSEELFKSPGATLRKVLRHVGLSDLATDQEAESMFGGFTIPKHVSGRQMLPEAYKLLHDFYAPYNKRLAEITGNPAFLEWNAAGGPATSAASSSNAVA